jgi:hypothetical protein
VVQPDEVELGVVDSAHNESLIDVVAASGFLDIRFTTRARNTALPPYVMRSHYVTMEAINCNRSHIAARPVYAIGEYLLLLVRACNHMLFLSCSLHNCQRTQLVRIVMTRTSVRNLLHSGHTPYYSVHVVNEGNAANTRVVKAQSVEAGFYGACGDQAREREEMV